MFSGMYKKHVADDSRIIGASARISRRALLADPVFRRALISAAITFSVLTLVMSSYWFLTGNHEVDGFLLFGHPNPAGAPRADEHGASIAWSFSAIGSPKIVFVGASSLFGFFLVAGCRSAAGLVVISIGGGAFGGYLMKSVFGYFRPHHLPGSAEMLNTSFPSGHALLATLFVGTAALIASRSLNNATAKAYIWISAAVVAFLSGASRIYLGTHWPSDVLAGWSAGFLWIIVADLICQSIFGPKGMGRNLRRSSSGA